MSKRYTLIKMFLILIVILIQCGFIFPQKKISKEKRPAWINNPSKGIFVGVSQKNENEQEARINAVKDAKRQIIQSLGVIIESEFVDRIIEQNENVINHADSKLKIVAKNIIAVKPDKIFVEKYQEKISMLKKRTLYQVFVSVPFSNKKHQIFMNELLSETERSCNQRYQKTIRLAKQGKVFFAIEELSKIGIDLSDISQITGISPEKMSGVKNLEKDVLLSLSDMQNNIYITGKGTDQGAKYGKGLKKPLELSILWKTENKTIGIPGVDVKFSIVNGNAEINETGKTNSSGIATCNVKKVLTGENLIIKAEVEFPKNTGIAAKSYKFQLFADNKIIVKVIEKNLNKKIETSYLENKLLEQFNNLGFTALENDNLRKLTKNDIEQINVQSVKNRFGNDNADLIVLAVITTGQINKIQDGYYFARARGVIKVYDREKQEIVVNFIEETKGAGNSEENAGVKAIKKVSDLLIDKVLNELQMNRKS